MFKYFVSLFIFQSLNLTAQDSIIPNGYIAYHSKYELESPFTNAIKITTLFGNSDYYVTYLNSFIKDPILFAKESAKLIEDKSDEAYNSFLNYANKENERNINEITVSYLINTKNRKRSTINYFYFSGKKNCYQIDTLKKLNYSFQDTLTKKILGYQCKKITLKTSKATYAIWYSEDLPFNVGPLAFFGAPGAILEVDAPEIKVGYLATEVNTKNIEKLLIRTIPFKHDDFLVTKDQYLVLLAKENNMRAAMKQ